MKICQQCQRTYENAKQRFCGEDGSPLVDFNPPAAANAAAAPTDQTPIVERTPQSVADALPPSLLIYFFSDQFVKAAGFLGGAEILCKQAKVNMNDLTDDLMAAAFWHLRERNLIAMRLGEKEGLIFKSSPVVVQSVQIARVTGGLERDFYEILRARQTPMTVEKVVVDHLREDTRVPRAEILERMKAWTVHAGAARFAQKKGWLLTKTIFEPDCARIQTFAGQIGDLQNRWRRFKTVEAELYNALVKQCGGAISLRTERRDSDDSSSSSSFD